MERKALEKELEGLLRPKPNKQILGLRPKLLIYNLPIIKIGAWNSNVRVRTLII